MGRDFWWRYIAVCVAFGVAVALAIQWGRGLRRDELDAAFASDYCAENGAVAVGQYCLTEAEIILRRVPERF